MDAFAVLGVPVRRRILEHLARGGELSAGALVALVQEEASISQPAVSQHLKALADAGMVTARAEGTRRIYSLRVEPILEAERWLAEVRDFWSQRLDALDTELARGRRADRAAPRSPATGSSGRSDAGRSPAGRGATGPKRDTNDDHEGAPRRSPPTRRTA